MEAHHLCYLEHNELPTVTHLHEIQCLKTVSLQELSALQAKTLEAERRAAALKRQCEAVQSSIQVYDSILSPMRRLPEDLLPEIFKQCLSSHRSPLMSAHEAPLLLTQICSKWRSIALATPRLWDSIVIPLPSHPDDFLALGLNLKPEEIEAFTDRMHKRCEAVPVWLERSRSLPLNLSLVYPTRFTPHQLEQETIVYPILETLMHNLLPFLYRIQKLELSMSAIFFDYVLKCMLPHPQKGLASLGILKLNTSPDSSYATIEGILSSPNLREVYLSIYTSFAGIRYATDIPSNWAQLTTLVMQEAAQDHEAYTLLQICRRLVTCKLYIYSKGDVHIPPWRTGSEVTHPHLEDLAIIDGGYPAGMSVTVLKTLRAPALRSFNYDQLRRSSSEDLDDSDTPWEWLFENSPGLTSLCFDPTKENHVETTPISYKLGENISTLLLGRPMPGGLVQIPLLDECRISQLSLLIAPSGSEGEILLPKLEVLRAYQPVCSSTDQELLDFIISRLDPARSDVAVLKEVTITFGRRQEKDIWEEVMQHAERAGVCLRLSLVYYIPATFPAQWHPGSASFALVDDRVPFDEL